MEKKIEDVLNAVKEQGIDIQFENVSSCDELDAIAEEYIKIGYRAGRESVAADRRAARKAERERKLEELRNRKPLFERIMNHLGYQKTETPTTEETPTSQQ